MTRWHWLAVTAFWLFITAMYTAQMLWLAQIPGERVNVRASVAWQASYYAVWIPFTILVWRVSGAWLADGRRHWVSLLLHLPLFAGVWAAIALMVSGIAPALAGQSEPFWLTYWIQLRGRAHLMVLIYTAVVGTGAALLMFQRYQDRTAAQVQLQAEWSWHGSRPCVDTSNRTSSSTACTASPRWRGSRTRPGVVRLTASLSEILRHVLAVGDRPSRLGDELAVVERYLEIERARFADCLDVALSGYQPMWPMPASRCWSCSRSSRMR